MLIFVRATKRVIVVPFIAYLIVNPVVIWDCDNLKITLIRMEP